MDWWTGWRMRRVEVDEDKNERNEGDSQSVGKDDFRRQIDGELSECW